MRTCLAAIAAAAAIYSTAAQADIVALTGNDMLAMIDANDRDHVEHIVFGGLRHDAGGP